MCRELIYVICLALVLALASSASAGLVGHWAFDEGSGTSARDSSGTNNHGTLRNGPQWIDGYISKALRFDGVDDYVEVPHHASLTVDTEVTVAAWINAERHTGPGGIDWQGILAKGESPRSYSLYTEMSGALHFSTAGVGTLSAVTVPLNEWVHVAAAVEGGQHKYYINGEPAGTSGGGITLPGAVDTATVMIGRTHETAREFLGMIDEVRIYDRSLTPQQVQDLFNGIAPSWLKAENPDPPDGATSVTPQALSWSPGETAKSHDLYFGTNPTPGPDEFLTRQDWTVYWYEPGFTPGATYYWRVDEVEADGTTIHTGDVWSFTAAALTAHRPNPPDGAEYVSINPELSWAAGANAILHDVYFGTSQTDVANGTGDTLKTMQATTTYEPGPLLKDTTYYWRIDEVVQGGPKRTGPVWSFTTIPDIPITDPNLVGWWKLDGGADAIVLDWSGLDNHGALVGNPQWVLGYDGEALEFDGLDDYVEVPHEASLTMDTEVTVMAWINAERHTGPGGVDWQGILAKSNDPRSYSFYTEASGALHFSTAGVASLSSGQVPLNEWVHVCAMVVGGVHRYYINGEPAGEGGGGITLPGATDTASVRIGNTNEGSREFQGMIDDVRIYSTALTQQEIWEAMRGDPSLAWDPSPANRYTADIDTATPLSWQPGGEAAQHDVYFGTDKDAVEDADASDTTGIYRGQQAATTYTPLEALQWGQTYYWRIDEVNTDATISRGRVWSFTVANYLIPDDFEAYDDYCNRIFYAWKDGWGHSADPDCGIAASLGNGTGSTVGNLAAPFAERNIVHGGDQSMPFEYDNTGAGGKARYSEASREFATPQNWTRNEVKALTLWFHGEPGNTPETLYVAVEDSLGQVRVATHPNPDALQAAAWQQWNIALTQFSGVNLGSVKKVYLGVGNRNNPQAGGSGKLYFDDIRLYRRRCVPSLAKPAADLSDNCIVDYADVDIIADQWLDSGFMITPTDPGNSGLIAHYPFNGNANDVVGGHNGTTTGIVSYGAGKIGQAIQLDGVDDYVDCGTDPVFNIPTNITVACWIRVLQFDKTWQAIVTKGDNSWRLHRSSTSNNIAWGTSGLTPTDITGSVNVNDGQWHHVVGVYDGTQKRLYVDGNLDASSNSTGNIGTSDYSVNIGENAQATGRYWTGLIDEVRIYSRALSGAEVAWLAGKTAPFSEPYDLNVDGVVDFKDFAVLADAWLDKVLWP